MESREEFVADLLEGGLELVSPSVLLMNRGFDTEAVRGVCERSGVTYLTGRRTGEHTRIDRPAAGGVDVFRDRELSLYEERTTLYERADSDEVDTTFAADDDEEEDDQTRQEGLRQEFDDALNVDLGVEDDQEERATWEAVGDLVDNAPTSTDNATYYL